MLLYVYICYMLLYIIYYYVCICYIGCHILGAGNDPDSRSWIGKGQNYDGCYVGCIYV